MDVIALHAEGVNNAVATLGTAITSEQARIMRKYTSRIFVSYDSDAAGQKAADKAIRLLTEVGMDVKIIHMEGAKDPDEFIKKFGVTRFRQMLEDGRSEFEFKLAGILSRYDMYVPEEKIKAVHAAAALLAEHTSTAAREVYQRLAAKKLDISAEALADEVRIAMRRKKRESERTEWKQVVGQAAGLGDRINPDHAKNPRAAGAEEAILGILLLHPELVQEIAAGKIELRAEQFVSAFHVRVFDAMLACGADGRFDIAKVGDRFTVDEIGRITKLQVERTKLSDNSRTVLLACIETLKDATDRTEIQDAAMAILARRKKGEEK